MTRTAQIDKLKQVSKSLQRRVAMELENDPEFYGSVKVEVYFSKGKLERHKVVVDQSLSRSELLSA